MVSLYLKTNSNIYAFQLQITPGHQNRQTRTISNIQRAEQRVVDKNFTIPSIIRRIITFATEL